MVSSGFLLLIGWFGLFGGLVSTVHVFFSIDTAVLYLRIESSLNNLNLIIF